MFFLLTKKLEVPLNVASCFSWTFAKIISRVGRDPLGTELLVSINGVSIPMRSNAMMIYLEKL
jgi:hypothetical protein